MTKKQIPIDIQNFAELRQGNYHYIDKTANIIELIKASNYLSLSRPNGFGKSFMLDTIAHLFAGNKALFSGLYAEQHWQWDQSYPVVQLDLKVKDTLSADEFLVFFNRKIDELEQRHQLPPTAHNTVAIRFSKFIKNYAQKTQQTIVVLVDNYDAVLLPHLSNTVTFEKIFSHIKAIYGVFTSTQRYTHFTLITGVLNLQVDNLFLAMNQQYDISLNSRFSALCGFTQSEIQINFASELENVDLNRLQNNSYSWTGESVYRPMDMLSFLSNPLKSYPNPDIDPHIATFLQSKQLSKDVLIEQLGSIGLDNQQLTQLTANDLNPFALLFQTGYLTIDSRQLEPFLRYSLKRVNIPEEVFSSNYMRGQEKSSSFNSY